MITLTWDEMCQSGNSGFALSQTRISHLTVGCYAHIGVLHSEINFGGVR